MKRRAMSAVVLVLPTLATAMWAGQAQGAPPKQSARGAGQCGSEAPIPKLLSDPRVIAAREKTKGLLESSPIRKVEGAAATLDHAVNSWLTALAQEEANGDAARPRVTWITNSSAYQRCGYTIPAANLAFEDPSNIYRFIPVDGGERYVIHGVRRKPSPAEFSFQLIPASFLPGTSGEDFIASAPFLSSRDISVEADGHFTITLDNAPANGRKNHLQLPAGRYNLLVRDALSDWGQRPNELDVARTGGAPTSAPPTEKEVAGGVAEHLSAFASGWLHRLETLYANRTENVMQPPFARSGEWGYASISRFRLAPDEAIIVTLDDAAADFASIQIGDAWGPAARRSRQLHDCHVPPQWRRHVHLRHFRDRSSRRQLAEHRRQPGRLDFRPLAGRSSW